MLTKKFHGFRTQIRAANADGHEMTFTASTESPDRYDEIVRISGWRLENFRKNPVFLFSHRSGDPPIGKVTEIHTESVPTPALVATVKFASGEYPFAATIEKLYRSGFLNAVSVGFLPLEEPIPRTDGGIGYEYTKQELLEISAVAVPAQPDALARAVRKGVLNTEQAEDFVRRASSAKLPEEFLRRLDAEEKEFSTIRTLDELMRALRS